jgi:hypothetical protein
MFEGAGKDTIELARQGLLGCIDRLKEVAVEFLDGTEIRVDPIRVWFKRCEKGKENPNEPSKK